MFENNLRIDHGLTKYLKESCGVSSDLCFAFKYFPKYVFVRKISPKSGGENVSYQR